MKTPAEEPATLQILSPEQVDRFHRDGYLVVPGFYDAHEAQAIQEWTTEIGNYPETPGKWMMYFEKSQHNAQDRLLSRVENFIPYHAGMEKLVCADKMMAATHQLFGERPVLFKDKINFKLPGGDGFKPHQDAQAGWEDYGTLHITVMVAVDEANASNGRLEFCPGQHRRGLIGERWAPMTEEQLAGMKFEPIDCAPGDAVFFDSYAPHQSDANLSQKSRRILYITYGKASEGDHLKEYYAEKRKNYPPDCERDPSKVYEFKV